MNIFKRLICEHEYKFFNKGWYLEFFSATKWDRYDYVCHKCGKESSLYEYALRQDIESLSYKVAKEKAMGIDNSAHDGEKFCLTNCEYSGKLAYYVRNKYKNYIQDKAISRY